jgi:hypothetical protein
LGNRSSDFDVLLGIQAFFHNNAVQGEKSESKFFFLCNKCTKIISIGNLMKFLLQFFLDHQCITLNIILNWYNNNDAHGYIGYEEAKQLAEPFIQSLFDNQY